MAQVWLKNSGNRQKTLLIKNGILRVSDAELRTVLGAKFFGYSQQSNYVRINTGETYSDNFSFNLFSYKDIIVNGRVVYHIYRGETSYSYNCYVKSINGTTRGNLKNVTIDETCNNVYVPANSSTARGEGFISYYTISAPSGGYTSTTDFYGTLWYKKN